MRTDQEIIRDFWTRVFPINDGEVLEEAIDLSIVIRAKKGEAVHKQGEVDRLSTFLYEGITKAVFADDNGKTMQTLLSLEKGASVGCGTAEGQEELIITATTIALKDCIFVAVPIGGWFRLLSKYPEFAVYFFDTVNQKNMMNANRLTIYVDASAEELVNWFYTEYSEYVNSIKKKDIADYLGIKQETLSRLLKDKKYDTKK